MCKCWSRARMHRVHDPPSPARTSPMALSRASEPATLPKRAATILSDGCQALSRPREYCSPAGSPIPKARSTDLSRSWHPKRAPAACLLDVTAQSIGAVVQNTAQYPGHDGDGPPCLGHPDTTPVGVERAWLLFLP